MCISFNIENQSRKTHFLEILSLIFVDRFLHSILISFFCLTFDFNYCSLDCSTINQSNNLFSEPIQQPINVILEKNQKQIFGKQFCPIYIFSIDPISNGSNISFSLLSCPFNFKCVYLKSADVFSMPLLPINRYSLVVISNRNSVLKKIVHIE